MKLTRKMLYTTLVVLCLISLFLNVSPVCAEVKPGDVIDAKNWQKAEGMLPPAILEYVKTYGQVVKVVEPKEYPWNQKYAEDTKKNAGTVKIENNCADYASGLPFPGIKADDSNAGIKHMWNHQFKHAPEQAPYPDIAFDFILKDGTSERYVRGYHGKMYFLPRVMNPPLPNPDRILTKEIMAFRTPKDVAGVGFLDIRYLSEKKDDDMYAYVPALRRLRRMSGAQRTDAYIGSDAAIEDYYGFSGKVTDETWKLVSRKKMLSMRNIGRNLCEENGKALYGPKWMCGDVPFEVVDMLVIEGKSKNPGHPYSKRVLYVDSERYMCHWAENFDKNGELWKVWMLPWRWWPNERVFTTPGITCADIQIPHGTVVPVIKSAPQADPNGPDGLSFYTIDQLEKTGH